MHTHTTYHCPRRLSGDRIGTVAALAVGDAVEACCVVALRIVVAQAGDAAIADVEAHAKKNQTDRDPKQASEQQLSPTY